MLRNVLPAIGVYSFVLVHGWPCHCCCHTFSVCTAVWHYYCGSRRRTILLQEFVLLWVEIYELHFRAVTYSIQIMGSAIEEPLPSKGPT